MAENKETLMTFPCDMTIKIMGNNGAEFEVAILTIVRKHYPNIKENAITTKLSSGDKYLSLSIKLHVTSKAEIDALYTEISACEHALFVL